MVDVEADRKFFNMVEGAVEEQRLEQHNTAEAIKTLDYGNIMIMDPLTGELINDIQRLVQKFSVDIMAIWSQSETFDAEEYLNKVHLNTSLQVFNQGMAALRDKLDSLDSSEHETKVQLIVANFDSFLAAK
jgi:hypothetical protein